MRCPLGSSRWGAGLVVHACVWVVHASPCSMGMGACMRRHALCACVGCACAAMLCFKEFWKECRSVKFLWRFEAKEEQLEQKKEGVEEVLKLLRIQK